MSTLIDTLKQVPDFRKAHGDGHSCWIPRFRPLETFATDYRQPLCKLLGLGNDYLIVVKRNQGRLYSHLQTYFEYLNLMAEHTHSMQSRGRDEHRCIKVYEPVGIVLQEWEAIRSVLCVQRWGTRQGVSQHGLLHQFGCDLTPSMAISASRALGHRKSVASA